MSILFTDLDYTLLNNEPAVSAKTRDVLRKMIGAGHKLVLASGRPLASIMEVREKEHIDFEGMYLLGNNGAVIYDCDNEKVIFEKTVPLIIVKNIWDKCWNEKLHVHTYTGDSIVSKYYDPEMDIYRSRIHMPVIYTDNPMGTLGTNEPYKMLGIDFEDKSRLDKLRDYVLEEYGDILTAVFSTDAYLEIFNKETDKGKALQWLCNYLGISLDEAFAAGDALNDLSMIKMAGNGIAMCNGNPELFPYAKYVSDKPNDEDGLADAIEKYILAK